VAFAQGGLEGVARLRTIKIEAVGLIVFSDVHVDAAQRPGDIPS